MRQALLTARFVSHVGDDFHKRHVLALADTHFSQSDFELLKGTGPIYTDTRLKTLRSTLESNAQSQLTPLLWYHLWTLEHGRKISY